jgi:catechol 2,3-dioxygenase-like lactoylglutathione lyase family enzyme
MADFQVIQVALTTTDLPAAMRFHAETFGFANAGGMPIWGDPMRLQGLDPSARAMMWWLLDGQPFFQIELFAHTQPCPRPKPADWKPSDHGWVRIGIAAPSLAPIERSLSVWSVPLLGEHVDADGTRRIAFTDPTSSALIEVIEAKGIERPTVRYATYSTADLERARAFYGETLGLPILGGDALHQPEHEALWGLAGSIADRFVVGSPGIWLEIVHYRQPAGRPKPAGSTIADLGIMNIALGTPDDGTARAAIGRVQAAGYATTPLLDAGGSVVTYLNEPGTEMELMSVSDELRAEWGFDPVAPFVGLSA